MDNSFNAIIDSIKKYFRGVRAEWGKITWPERQQVMMETIFVIFIVTAFTIAVYLMDIIFKTLLGFIK
jgi:preprotein translocase subunit SecE